MIPTLLPGDCLAVMADLRERGEVFHACVTDPPYHLMSIVKRFSKCGGATRTPPKKDHQYGRLSRGFVGKEWDGGDVAFDPATWRAVHDLLPPGGHLAAFGGTRTFHRMAVAIEDAGFEIRDTLMWLYGTGFPKSHNAGDGWGTALKPAWEPIILARKPLAAAVAANRADHGTGAINIEACRIPGVPESPGSTPPSSVAGRRTAMAGPMDRVSYDPSKGRWPANVIHDGSREVVAMLGAARFFYSAKANAADRAGSKHPTVKPVELMRWLLRLVVPPGGRVLDPFAGSGTTGIAAHMEGFASTLIEREAEYQADIRRRIAALAADAGLFAAE